MIKNKKAAIEMSMGTIIILVLGVSMLILGMVLIRNIMCSGVQITEELSAGVKNEITNLFGADRIGVKCMGEGGAEVKLGTGGRRAVVCILKTQEQVDYDLKLASLESLTGAPTATVKNWVISQDWTGTVRSGQDQEEVVLLMNIPRDAPQTTLKLSIQAKNPTSEETITSFIDIVPTGFIRGAIC